MANDRLTCLLSSMEEELIDTILIKILKNKENSCADKSLEDKRLIVDTQIRRIASNDIVSFFRRSRHPYKQILVDVADKLAPGYTVFSWTDFKLKDQTQDVEIEKYILKLLEFRFKDWWTNMNDKNKKIVIDQYAKNIDLDGFQSKFGKTLNKEWVVQQVVENIVQAGFTGALANVGAGGLLGLLGGSLLTSIGWTIVANTLGFWFCIKALLGVSFVSLATVASTVVGGVVSIPGLVLMATHTNYRKLVPVIALVVIYADVNNL